MRKNKLIVEINLKTIAIYIIIIIVIIFIIYISLFIHVMPNAKQITNSDWLQFWASFIGGAIGGITTLFAVYYTLNQNLKDRENDSKNNKEMKRLEVIPYLNSQIVTIKSSDVWEEPSGYILFDKKNKDYHRGVDFSADLSKVYKNQIEKRECSFFTIKVTNIGIGAAVNIILDLYDKNDNLLRGFIEPEFNLNIKDKITLTLIFSNYSEGTYYLRFSISDIFMKNFYVQIIKFEYTNDKFTIYSITYPKLMDDSDIRKKYMTHDIITHDNINIKSV